MKKILTFALCMASAAAFAEDMEADCGDVGVLQVTTTQKNIVIPAAFKNLDGNPLTLDNLVKTTGMSGGEKLYIYSNGFKGWQFNGTTRVWDPMAVASASNGGVTVAAGDPASSQTCSFGSGIWFQRDSNDSVALTIYGKPVATPGAVAVSGTMLVANTTASAATPTITGAAKGDIIKIPSDSVMQKQYTYDGSNWKGIDSTTHLPVTGLPSIPAGTGFWWKGGSVTISW